MYQANKMLFYHSVASSSCYWKTLESLGLYKYSIKCKVAFQRSIVSDMHIYLSMYYFNMYDEIPILGCLSSIAALLQ